MFTKRERNNWAVWLQGYLLTFILCYGLEKLDKVVCYFLPSLNAPNTITHPFSENARLGTAKLQWKVRGMWTTPPLAGCDSFLLFDYQIITCPFSSGGPHHGGSHSHHHGRVDSPSPTSSLFWAYRIGTILWPALIGFRSRKSWLLLMWAPPYFINHVAFDVSL